MLSLGELIKNDNIIFKKKKSRNKIMLSKLFYHMIFLLTYDLCNLLQGIAVISFFHMMVFISEK